MDIFPSSPLCSSISHFLGRVRLFCWSIDIIISFSGQCQHYKQYDSIRIENHTKCLVALIVKELCILKVNNIGRLYEYLTYPELRLKFSIEGIQ